MEILTGGRQGLGPFECSEAGVLVDARDYYRAFVQSARHARSYLALAGWQFDPDLVLLRGEDAEGDEPLRLLPFLESLLAEKPELRIYLLAWDFGGLFGLDRPWMKQWVRRWTKHPRIQFRFDTSHASAACHHQKVVMVDGDLAFVGGIDLSSGRWDSRSHESIDALREESFPHPHGPIHDLQSYVRGPAAIAPLGDLLRQRWTASGGGPLELRAHALPPLHFDGALPLPTEHVWFSRTQGRTLRPPQEPQEEIRHLFADAIVRAQSLIYLETPAFTSRVVYDAFVKRMLIPGKPLDVVFMLPKEPESLSLGVVQARLLRELAQLATRHGHRFGTYYTAAVTPSGEEVPTAIHSGLLLVDDRFISLGSASTTNRGMTLDTELNLNAESTSSWPLAKLRRALKALRVSLLAEHAGVGIPEANRVFRRREKLVTALDNSVSSGLNRLRKHAVQNPLERMETLQGPRPGHLEEAVIETVSRSSEGLFAHGIRELHEWLQPGKSQAWVTADAQLLEPTESTLRPSSNYETPTTAETTIPGATVRR